MLLSLKFLFLATTSEQGLRHIEHNVGKSVAHVTSSERVVINYVINILKH